MRFVAGRGAVLRCCVQGSVAEMLLAGAPWRSCCWLERRGGAIAGRSAVAEAIGNQLLAGALWLSCCWPGRRGEAVAGREPLAQRTACRSSEAELHREELTAPQKTMWLHREELTAPRKTMRLQREANKRTQKEKGPEETLISLPSHFYLLPCERATRAGEVAAAIMQGLQGRLQQMQELRRALGIRQG